MLKIKERIKGPSGIYNIQNEWYGYADEFKYTIGLSGLTGFGVGCCPPDLLPDDMAPMDVTRALKWRFLGIKPERDYRR